MADAPAEQPEQKSLLPPFSVLNYKYTLLGLAAWTAILVVAIVAVVVTPPPPSAGAGFATLGPIGVLDSFFASASVGITVWYFFLQSPHLFMQLGFKKFVPLMMTIMVLYMDVQFNLGMLVLVLSIARVGGALETILAAVAAGAALFNRFVLTPRALIAGRASRPKRNAAEDSREAADAAKFASLGADAAGDSDTALWHRLVVIFVLMHTGAMLTHVVLL